MFTLDSQIDALILKWANNPEGTWSEVVEDLIKYKEVIKEEVKAELLQTYKEDDQVAA